MTAQVLFFDVFSEKDPHLNAVEKFFTENLFAIEIKKTEILMNKFFHLGFLVPELSTILMYEFWYDYVKPKYGEEVKIVLYGYR